MKRNLLTYCLVIAVSICVHGRASAQSGLSGSGSSGLSSGGMSGLSGTGVSTTTTGTGSTSRTTGTSTTGTSNTGTSQTGSSATGGAGSNANVGSNTAGSNGAQSFIGANATQGFIGGGGIQGGQNQNMNRQFQSIQNTQQQNRNQSTTGTPRSIRTSFSIGFAAPSATAPEFAGKLAAANSLTLSRFSDVHPELAGINVAVNSQGVAVLTGTADTTESRRLAANLIRLQPGVRKVDNQISVNN